MSEDKPLNVKLAKLLGRMQPKHSTQNRHRSPADRPAAILIDGATSVSITIHEHHYYGTNPIVPPEAQTDNNE